MERIETENGNAIKIWHDEDAENPRENCDNLWKWICFHNRYKLGDKHDYKETNFSSWEDVENMLREDFGDCFLKPLSMIDHSGLHVYRGSGAHACDPGGWDSGMIGFAVLSKEAARKEFGRLTKKKREIIDRNLEGEIETYNQYLSGEVYGFTVYSPSGERLDSCGGLFGYEYCLEEAKAMAKFDSPEMKELKETAASIT